jgi:hypothetical protein
VVFPAAVITADITGRRYRQMDAAVSAAAAVKAGVAQRLEKIRAPVRLHIPYQKKPLIIQIVLLVYMTL